MAAHPTETSPHFVSYDNAGKSLSIEEKVSLMKTTLSHYRDALIQVYETALNDNYLAFFEPESFFEPKSSFETEPFSELGSFFENPQKKQQVLMYFIGLLTKNFDAIIQKLGAPLFNSQGIVTLQIIDAIEEAMYCLEGSITTAEKFNLALQSIEYPSFRLFVRDQVLTPLKEQQREKISALLCGSVSAEDLQELLNPIFSFMNEVRTKKRKGAFEEVILTEESEEIEKEILLQALLKEDMLVSSQNIQNINPTLIDLIYKLLPLSDFVQLLRKAKTLSNNEVKDPLAVCPPRDSLSPRSPSPSSSPNFFTLPSASADQGSPSTEKKKEEAPERLPSPSLRKSGSDSDH